MIGKLKRLYGKYREAVTYVFFGGCTTLVGLIVRYAAFYAGIELNIADIISWVCAVTFAFFVNKVFVFRNKSSGRKEWIRQAASFYAARLLTLGVQLVFMNVTVYVLGLREDVMILVVQVFIFVGNYLLSKFLIFRKKG
ncbi:MAG: GtrA family protein [Oscillospiraceae bacterium]|nr:GtrA family protein [Oscillospiraceae bacterium]